MTPWVKRPCLVCGDLTTNGTRCDEHQVQHDRATEALREGPNFWARGYDHAWAKLSKRARSMQGYCTDCGTTENLTLDHLPAAWQAKAEGRPITLRMVDVLCRSCNARKGDSRPGSARWSRWVETSSASDLFLGAEAVNPGGSPGTGKGLRPEGLLSSPTDVAEVGQC